MFELVLLGVEVGRFEWAEIRRRASSPPSVAARSWSCLESRARRPSREPRVARDRAAERAARARGCGRIRLGGDSSDDLITSDRGRSIVIEPRIAGSTGRAQSASRACSRGRRNNPTSWTVSVRSGS